MIFRAALRRWQVPNVAIALAAAVLLFWTVFPFVWILLTSLKSPGDMLADTAEISVRANARQLRGARHRRAAGTIRLHAP